MKLSSSFVSLHVSIPLLSVQLLFLATLSFAFLTTAFLPKPATSQLLSRFSKFPIQSSVKGDNSISSWSKIAEFDVLSSSFHLIDTNDVSSIRRSTTYDLRKESSSYSLASPREWLEYCEASQRRTRQDESQQQRQDDSSRQNLDDDRSGGAYTVLRCEFLMDEKSWRIWGEDYHLNRIRESYRSLLYQVRFGRGEHQEIDRDAQNLRDEELAVDSSREVMNILLEEAKRTILSKSNMSKNHSKEKREKSIIIVMLTLLWDVDHNKFEVNDNSEHFIRVQGHAFSTMKASQLNSTSDIIGPSVKIVAGANPNIPLQAVIGHLPTTVIERITKHKNYDRNQSGPNALPNRYQNFPQAKLSSWCRRRHLLEDIFKTIDIGDVILTKNRVDKDTTNSPELPFSSMSEGSFSRTTKPSVQLLEGLTTNLFVVYPGKILRTAPSTHVLEGYVRHLIIDCAEKCGYKVEFGSISMEDSFLWEEVFLTSSIRLIMPVNRIFLPIPNTVDKDDKLFQLDLLWELSSKEALNASDVLYMELMKHATLYGCESSVM